MGLLAAAVWKWPPPARPAPALGLQPAIRKAGMDDSAMQPPLAAQAFQQRQCVSSSARSALLPFTTRRHAMRCSAMPRPVQAAIHPTHHCLCRLLLNDFAPVVTLHSGNQFEAALACALCLPRNLVMQVLAHGLPNGRTAAVEGNEGRHSHVSFARGKTIVPTPTPNPAAHLAQLKLLVLVLRQLIGAHQGGVHAAALAAVPQLSVRAIAWVEVRLQG